MSLEELAAEMPRNQAQRIFEGLHRSTGEVEGGL
jgi:hypothetical protein